MGAEVVKEVPHRVGREENRDRWEGVAHVDVETESDMQYVGDNFERS